MPRVLVPVSQNIYSRSEELDHADWTRYALASVTPNVIAGPVELGSPMRGARITAAAGLNYHGLARIPAVKVPAGQWNAASAYAKADTYNFFGISFDYGTHGFSISVDLTTGKLTYVSSALIGAHQVMRTRYAGDGWWFIEAGFLNPVERPASSYNRPIIGLGTSGAYFNAAGTESIYMIGISNSDANHTGQYIRTEAAPYNVGPMRNRVIVPANYVVQSQALDDAAWTKLDASITANTTVAPDGTLTADKLVENGANAEHAVYQVANSNGWGDVVSVSAHLKGDGSGRYMLLGVGFSGPFLCYDPTTRAVVATSGTGIVRAEAVPSDLDPGWDKVTLAVKSSVDIAQIPLLELRSTAGATRAAYLGNGSSGMYIWGVQATRGDHAGPYVESVGVAVNGTGRNKPHLVSNYVLDNRNIQGANFTDIAVTRTGGQVDPFGGTEACKIAETAAVSNHSVYNSGSLITFVRPGGWVCGSAYLKAAERNFGSIYFDLGSSLLYAVWNLTTGAVSATAAVGSAIDPGQWIADAAESIGNGWWRCSLAFRSLIDLRGGFYSQILLSSNGTLVGYAGSAGQGIYAFAPGASPANHPGPLTNTTSPLAVIANPLRNKQRGRVAA